MADSGYEGVAWPLLLTLSAPHGEQMRVHDSALASKERCYTNKAKEEEIFSDMPWALFTVAKETTKKRVWSTTPTVLRLNSAPPPPPPTPPEHSSGTALKSKDGMQRVIHRKLFLRRAHASHQPTRPGPNSGDRNKNICPVPGLGGANQRTVH